MTWLDPQNPAFQGGILPFLVALICVGALYFVSGTTRGKTLAVFGIAIALVAAYWIAFAVPPFPPRAASQKLGYLIVLAGILSLLFGTRPDLARIWRPVIFAVVIGGLAWIAESKLKQGNFTIFLLTAFGGSVVLFGLFLARDKPVETGAAVLASALAMAGIAILAPSASIAHMALAVAAATGGYMLWTWPKPRLQFGEAGVVATAAPLIWLGGQSALYSKASGTALAVACLIAFAPFVRALVLGRVASRSDALRPIITGCIGGLIAAVALAIAYLTQSAGSGY